ncbi:hypothetical protein B7463_g1778, partial [Scytalidium lignicola]
MRTSLPFVSCIIAKLSPYRDTVIDVVKIPEGAYKDPLHYICSTRSLRELKIKNTATGAKQVRSRGSTPSHDWTAPSTLLNNQQVQWHLRSRKSSENSSQPISAPTEISAQQAENFQRFYRAVVSPTHVRVTAGGRIVPNTRAMEQPKFISAAENANFGPQKQPYITGVDATNAGHFPQNQAFSTSFDQLPAGNIQQKNHIIPAGFQFPLPRFSLPNQDQVHGVRSSKDLTDGIGSMLQPEIDPQHIQLSHPSQFDHTKPFVYNGQLIWPTPPGFQPPPNAQAIPITMLGNPNPIPISPVSTPFLPSVQSPVLTFPNEFPGIQSSLDHQIAAETSPIVGNSLSISTQSPRFLASDITQHQIAAIRRHLSYIDNQLKNNRHQISEMDMLSDRQSTLAHLEQIEAMLHVQLAQEKGIAIPMDQFKNRELPKEGKGPTHILEENLSMKYARESIGSTQTRRHIDEDGKLQGSTADKFKVGLSTNSRLTMAAAKAPPFQPRGFVETSSLDAINKDRSTDKPPALLPSAEAAEINERLLSASSGQWNANSRTQPAKVDWARVHRDKIEFDKARATGKPISRPHMSKSVAPSHISNRNHERSGASKSFTEGVTNLSPARPYLVGLPPPGKLVSQVQSSDFVYSRPLTAEEVRARHLYWGNAPRAVQAGLPKFDGKDFYPASPAKGVYSKVQSPSSSPLENSPPQSLFLKISPPSDVPDFGDLFSETSPIPESVYKALSDTTDSYSQEFIKNYSKHLTESNLPDQHKIRRGNKAGKESHLGSTLALPSHDQPSLPIRPAYKALLTRSEAVSTHGIASSNMNRSFPRQTNLQSNAAPGQSSVLNSPTDDTPSTYTRQSISHETPQKLGQAHSTRITSSMNTPSGFSVVDVERSPKLIQHDRNSSPICNAGASFARRVATSESTEKQNLFLQTMLRHTAGIQMSAPAVSGAVSPTTAQGFLPLYCDSATASCSPAMTDVPTTTNDSLQETFRHEGFTPAYKALENMSLKYSTSARATRPSVDNVAAEPLLRYLVQKAEEDQKTIGRMWNGSVQGAY